MSLKTDYGNYNEDDFVEERGELKELTVTVTLCEYRNLVTELARSEYTIANLTKRFEGAEKQAKLMTDVVMLDHPEFVGDLVEAATNLLKKMSQSAIDKEVGRDDGETKAKDDLPPEIVFCKDCKHRHWEQEPCHGKTIHYCKVFDVECDDRFFCARGEAK